MRYLVASQGVRGTDYRIGQIRCSTERCEYRRAHANALNLDTQHLAAEEPAQLGGSRIAAERSPYSLAIPLRAWAISMIKLRLSNQLFGEMHAVLEQIDDIVDQGRILIEQLQLIGI